MDPMMSLPTGTVTFLFTDIEGSTRLWEQKPESMREALAQHDTLLRTAIESHTGHVFKTMGDAFCAVFGHAQDAVRAAIEAQAALQKRLPQVRVRMALHTGAAEVREGDYFGPALSRVDRLKTAGHGGQILLSRVTADLVRPFLPADAHLRSLGTHRLRDIATREGILQLLIPGLPSEFPPLNTLDIAFRRGMLRASAVSAVVVVVIGTLALTAVDLARRADQARRYAQTQQQKAEEGQRALRQHLYAAQMSVAWQAMTSGNMGRALELLEAQRPQRGQEDLRGFEWRQLWRFCYGDVRFTFRGHTGSVSGVAFSSDGKLIATGGDDRTVKLWDLYLRREVATLAGHTHNVHWVRFSPNGAMLASGSSDKTVRLWDVASRREVACLRGHKGEICPVAFSPDGKLLVSGGTEAVKLWDVASRREIASLETHIPWFSSLAFSPDGRLLATGSYDGRVSLWNVAARRRTAVPRGHVKSARALAFSPDGKTLATGSEDNTIRLWHVATRTAFAILAGHGTWATSLMFSPDGKRLAACGDDVNLRIWEVATRRAVVTLRGHGSAILDVAFSPDGKSVASASADGTVKLWDAAPKQHREILNGHEGAVWSAAFSPDGEMIATGGRDGAVRLWDVATGRERDVRGNRKHEVFCVAFSPDGKTLVAGGADQKLWLWDVSSRQAVAALAGHTQLVKALAFSPDGTKLVSASYPHVLGKGPEEVKLWEVATRREVATLIPQGGLSVAYSPDGKTAAVASWNEMRRWQTAIWRQLPPLITPMDACVAVAFAPDGQLAIGTFLGMIAFPDISGRMAAAIRGDKGSISSLAFSPDGRTLATGGSENVVKLWNMATRQEVGALAGHTGSVTAVVFSPDGKTLASASQDGSVRLWRASPFAETDAPEVAHLPRASR